MQHTRRIASALLASCSLVIASCSMTTEGQEQLAGAGIGAATGAAIGAAASGGNPRAVAIGAGSGAVAGWGAVKLAQLSAKRTQSAQQENSIQGWKTGDPARVKMRGVYVRPDPTGPGSQTTIAMNYGVTGPRRVLRLGAVAPLALIVGIEELTSDQCTHPDGEIVRGRDDGPGAEGIGRILPRVVIGL